MNKNEFGMQIRSLTIKVIIIGDDADSNKRKKIQMKSRICIITYKGWTDTDCHVSFAADVLNE